MQGPPAWNGFPLMDPKKYVYPGQIPLFSLAFYDGGTSIEGAPPQFDDTRPLHPVPVSGDDFKDLSLKEILDLSEELLSESHDDDDDDDPLMTTPILEPPPLVPPPNLSSSISMDIVHPISPNGSLHVLENTKKRRRGSNETSTSSIMTPRFREYQAGQWSTMFDALCEYNKKYGNCMVPYTYAENRALARWVKRQRYQYKLWKEGQPSTMTPDRARALSNIGFCWDSQTSCWMERLEELKQFKEENGHCNVPSQYPENPQLATWIKCQRRQYKLLKEGKPYNITPQRIDELNRLGFTWEIRSPKKQRV